MRYIKFACVVIFALWCCYRVAIVWGQEPPAIQRGEYILRSSGGCSCHTDEKNKGAFMAGGRAIQTPYGVVYSTNITPDPKTGIGTWSDAVFLKALTKGIGPKSEYYYPAFPYTSFTRIQERDILDLKAYLFSLPPVEKRNRPPDLSFPLGWRTLLIGWRWLYFSPGSFQSNPSHSSEWNRGAYLVAGPAHCGECHTPRNFLGGLETKMAYAGAANGPEGQLAQNITPDTPTGIGQWSIPDLIWFLQTGIKPDGDDAQGLMSEVIQKGYKHLTKADLRAMAVFLKSLKAITNKVKKLAR